MPGERILVVDDEPGVRSMLEVILEDEGYVVDAVQTGEEGIAAATRGEFDALLLDVWLPGIDGIETLARLKSGRVDAEVVMISGHGTIDTAVKATKLGAFDFVEKPLSLEKTLLVVRNALRQRRLEQRNRSLLAQLTRDTEIVGESDAARRTRRDAAAAAGSDASVLICGERGSGRETVARNIHAASRRAGQALVHVSCGALAGPGGEAALFGARPDEGGRLALARGGSLFLEDLDALPTALQGRLASSLTAEADVRLIASAAADAAGIVSPLRERVDVLRIAIAPLRERREDIPVLALRFMRDLAREYGRPERRFDEAALAAVTRYDWPGNVRALRNLVERLLLAGGAGTIRPEELPPELGGATPASEDLYAPYASLAEGLQAFERYFLRRALREAKGDADAAARRAGVGVERLLSGTG
ncbi:MAG TPA: sigma-54 dependent transcriptional regulator [Candidatus Polarisedimenticolaceae bacterium]|nr:sigma-54 dependent transcriptional regulator [Candidatus Polarisedimenticolaceae bacterium]